ncbi:unnamed protein product [Durusdinium trenchii]
MAGIYTVDEVQYQIVKGPEFSRDDSPFMLENFLEVEPEEGDYDKLQEGEAGSESTGSNSDDGNKNNVNRMIHAAFERYGKPDMPAKFWHKDEEWLSRCEGRGTRKRAAAHALLVRGTGIFRVNGNEDMYARWPQIYNRIDVCQPFKLTGTAGLYDVFVAVRGGGWSGQAGATRLAIARALFQANPACHDRLQEGFCLLEDTRQKMSSMAGRPGSQSNYAWNKR